jgi:rhodanese-related sulfurtransferase
MLPELYANGHIPDAMSIPAEEVRASAGQYSGDMEIVTYTGNIICKESIMADISFIEMGFENAWDYAGGMADWAEKGRPVEKINK